jgi:hypothetical protein
MMTALAAILFVRHKLKDDPEPLSSTHSGAWAAVTGAFWVAWLIGQALGNYG